MVKKLVIVLVLLAAAVVFGLWRAGLIDDDAARAKAAELRDRAEDGVKRAGQDAAKAARDAVAR